MQKANIPNYIDILAITPVRQWNNLEKIYLANNISEQEKIFKNIQIIFENISETYIAIKNDSINIMWDVMWRGLFYGIQVAWVEILFISYLDEYYPEWRKDLENNINNFISKIKLLLKPEEIKKYLENFWK